MKSKDKYGRDSKYIVGHANRKYDDPTEYKRAWNHRHRKERYTYKTQHAHDMKVKFIHEKGGKCSKCGEKYNGKNAAIFDFHHRDPKTKQFNLGINTMQNKSKKVLLIELEKCDLVCANCHRLIHGGGW